MTKRFWRALQNIWFNRNRERDSALIVSFLVARGSVDRLDLSLRMKDHTRGAHDWMLMSDRRIYRLLDALEAEGAVVSSETSYGRKYRLAAPAERLVRVK